MSTLIINVTEKTLSKNIESQAGIKNLKIIDLIGFQTCIREKMIEDTLKALVNKDYNRIGFIYGIYLNSLPSLSILMPNLSYLINEIGLDYFKELYSNKILDKFLSKVEFKVTQEFKEKAFKFYLLNNFKENATKLYNSKMLNGLFLHYIKNKTEWFNYIQAPKHAIYDSYISYSNSTIIKINSYMDNVKNIVQLDKEDCDRLNKEFKDILIKFAKELNNRNSQYQITRFYDPENNVNKLIKELGL